MDKEQLELKLTQIASLSLAIVVLFGTITRPLFNEQSSLFTLIGFVNFFFALACYWCIKKRVLIKYAAHCVVLVTLVCLIPLLLISGGINSQFTVLMPLIPVFTCLFANIRVVFTSSSCTVLLVFIMHFNHQWFIDVDMFQVDHNKQIAKAFWLIIAICVSASFGYYYRVQSQKIRTLLHKYAYVDPLTEIPNRRFIEDTLARECARNQRGEYSFGVMMIDVDHFKMFNDNFGHHVGDWVLKNVAKSIQANIRITDYVGRYGGEEFLLIIPNVTKQDLVSLGNKLVATIANNEVCYHEEKYRVTISCGAVWLNRQCEMSNQTIQTYADKALYTAKHQGRNCFYLYE